jgi:hypothetical protein
MKTGRWVELVAYEPNERYIQHFNQKTLSGRSHFENLSIDGRIQLEYIIEEWSEFYWLPYAM